MGSVTQIRDVAQRRYRRQRSDLRSTTGADATIIPFIPQERLFLTGVSALCRPFTPLVEQCRAAQGHDRLRMERILTALFKSCPSAPRDVAYDDIDALLNGPGTIIADTARRHLLHPEGQQHYLRWQRLWSGLEGKERLFAQRCAVALTVLLLRESQARTASA